MPDSTATTIGEEAIERCSAALRSARTRRVPIAPLTEELPHLSISDAYAVAQRTVAADVADGARIVGHKIGLTAESVQAQLGVSEPDYGALLDSMEIANGACLQRADFIAPRLELELAFRLGRSLAGPGVTTEDVRAATASVHPAIELVDSRIADWRITLADTVADNASSAGFVVGETSFELADRDVSDIAVSLFKGGQLVEQGRSAAVLGDPCVAVAWLANALGAMGHTIEAGEIVLSGACTRMAWVEAGDRFRAVFDGLGELALEFDKEDA